MLGQHRSTQRKRLKDDADERLLTADIIELARSFGRYGYRRIHALLVQAGWDVGLSVVERIWRREGLKVPQKQPKRRRLWLNDGSCIRLRPERRGHVWSYDFVEDITQNGRKYRMLNIVDEFRAACWPAAAGVASTWLEATRKSGDQIPAPRSYEDIRANDA